MLLTLSKEAVADIISALAAAVCAAERDVESWDRKDLEVDPEVRRTCLGYDEERLRKRIAALGAFREAVSNGRG